MVGKLAAISCNAVTPDQLLPYVAAVSGLESVAMGQCVLHHSGGQGVLVAYNQQQPDDMQAMNESVALALEFPGLERLTVLGPGRPEQTPVDAEGQSDYYWEISLPAPKPGVKLRNMLKRAARDIKITATSGENCWQEEHAALVRDFCQRKRDSLDDGTRYLFERLGDYLAAAPAAILFSARTADDKLAAFAIGDYTSLTTAFYMFAARAAAAPPGTADLLLQNLIAEAESRGHSRVNLGLGIDPGIEFFKKKWGATPFLPYIETSWNLAPKPKKKGFFARLFGN